MLTLVFFLFLKVIRLKTYATKESPLFPVLEVVLYTSIAVLCTMAVFDEDYQACNTPNVGGP